MWYTTLFISLLSVISLTRPIESNHTESNKSITAISSLNWDYLGKRTANFRNDRDVIKVGFRDGTYRKLKFVVTRGHLDMNRVVIQYANGQKDVLNMRHNFRPNSTSRILDLKGRNRAICDITFYYDTDNRSRRRAVVKVYGLQ